MEGARRKATADELKGRARDVAERRKRGANMIVAQARIGGMWVGRDEFHKQSKQRKDTLESSTGGRGRDEVAITE